MNFQVLKLTYTHFSPSEYTSKNR